MVKMHPQNPAYITNPAERKVFEWIRSTFPDGCEAFCNIRWKDGNYDKEADFVVFHPNGIIILLEVKGTEKWKRQNNKWLYADGSTPSTNPDDQVIGNKNSIKEAYYREHYSNSTFSIVGGLVFPDWAPTSQITNPTVPVYHKGISENLYDWTESKLISRVLRYVTFPSSMETRIRTFKTLAAMECYPKLSELIESVSDEISQNTLKRLEQTLDEIKDEKGQLVEGLAGCGKTWLAEKLLDILYNNQNINSIFVTCKNISLACHLIEVHPQYVQTRKCVIQPLYEYAESVLRKHDHIRQELILKKYSKKEEHYYWQTILKEFSRRLQSYNIKYDAIIVDEAQMLDSDGWDCIRKMRSNDGYLYVFSDNEQKIYNEVNNKLPWFDFDRKTLKYSIRNSGNIFRFATAHFQNEEITNKARSDDGLPVWVRYYSDTEDMKRAIVSFKKMLIDQGVDVKDIILLTPKVKNSALYDESNRDAPKDIGGVTLVEPIRKRKDYPDPKLFRTTIQKFRGRERRVVILAELDEGVDGLSTFVYVGATRAKVHLIVLMNKNVSEELKALYGQYSLNITGCCDNYEKIMDKM